MSGALKSVFGGNGGLFSAVLGVASMFFPPLAIAGSLSNLLTSAVGEAVKMAASQLVQQFAMPKFLEGVIGQVVDRVLPSLLQHSDAEVDQHVQQQAGSGVQQFQTDFAGELVKQTLKNLETNRERTSGTGTASSGKGAKVSAGSWLEAIARAMGEVMGEKAAKMVDLSNQMAQLSASGDANSKALAQKYGDVSNLKGEQLQKYQSEKSSSDQENARDMSRISSELQGTSQMLSMLQNSFSNSIKTIGEALSQAARKG